VCSAELEVYQLAVATRAGHALSYERLRLPGSRLDHAELQHVYRGERAADKPLTDLIGERLYLG
jgi:hypothetical protein